MAHTKNIHMDKIESPHEIVGKIILFCGHANQHEIF